MLLPGPGGAAAGDLHRLAAERVGGGLIAGVLFVLPGVVAMLGAVLGVRRARRHRAGHRAVPRAGAGRGRRSSSRRWCGSAGAPWPTRPWSRSRWRRSLRSRCSACRSRWSCWAPGVPAGCSVARRPALVRPRAGRAPTTGRRRWSPTTRCTRRAPSAAPQPGDPGRRAGPWVAPVALAFASPAATVRLRRPGCSSAAWRWSPSAAPTRCCRTSPRRPWRRTAGSRRARWSRARAGRDHARAADHGGPVRRLPGRLPRPRQPRPLGGGRARPRCSPSG